MKYLPTFSYSKFLVLILFVFGAAGVSARDTTTVSLLKAGKFGGESRGIDFINANTGFAVGDGTNTITPTNNFIARTTDGGNSWQNITPPELVSRPWSVDFVNANTGIVTGYTGMILRTTNGGTNWSTITSGTTSNIYEVVMTSVDTGYACGALSTVVLKTVDGGATWSSITVTGTNTRYGIAYTNGSNVWICGTSGNIISTTNGGTSWTTVTVTGSPTQYDIIRVGTDLWTFSSSNGLYKSTDNGATFALVFDNGSRAIYQASVFGPSSFICVGVDGLNYRTTNGGTTFDSTALTSFTGQTSRSVYMKSASDIIVGSDMGNMFRSTNGGTSFYLTETANRMYGMDFLNATTGVAVGYSGMIFKTTNAGLNWQNLPSGLSFELYDVQMFDANTFYIAGASGRFIITTNGGAAFTERNLPNITSGATKSLWFFNANTGFAVGEMGNAYYTTDAGVTWNSNFSWGTSFNNMEDVYFVNNSTGYIAGERGRFIKTSDGGLTWDSTGIDGPNLNTIWEMDWLNASTGYMASINGTIFKSTNAGANWSLLNDTAGLSGVDVIDIEVIDTGRGFAVGEQGKLFKQFSQNQWVVERSLTAPFGTEENLWGIDFVSTSSGFMCGYYGTIYKIDATVITSVPNTGLPLVYSLGQNYPNPFNPATVIKFSVPEASQVTMKVYDILGKELFVLVNSKMQSGNYEVSFNASQLPSGVYFYKMEAGSFSETKKMMLIK